MADDTRLLVWLEQHAEHGSPVRRAIYEGLATRVRRGDFTAREDHR